jgi:uncharacterized protein (DUF1501 family)
VPTLRRREFLTAGVLALGGTLMTSRVAFATTGSGEARVVFVIMRGALDGLAVVPPYGDSGYATLRRELALAAPDAAGGALPLNGFFGLHPSLSFLKDRYVAGDLIVFHAVASPYRERSHFDGQDVLENGSVHPHALQTGWLNRALASLQATRPSPKELGVALGQNVPLLMRGPASVTSWSASRLAALDDDTLERVTDLYAADPLLSKRLADALAADAIAGESEPMMGAGPGPLAPGLAATGKARPARYTEIVRAAAGFLRREDGPRVAVFDTTGWDTHANEGGAEGQLAGRLAALDEGLRSLREELGPVWSNTAVVLATEFGRTVATNGTRGTDHGTATACFVLGGAIHGGRVVTDWPGLSARELYQGRDLRPTLDLRSVLKGVLAEHLQVSSGALEDWVFPDSAAAKPIKGLVRA